MFWLYYESKQIHDSAVYILDTLNRVIKSLIQNKHKTNFKNKNN